MDEAVLKARVEALLERCEASDAVDWFARGNELFHGTLTVLSTLYGEKSNQVENLESSFRRAFTGIRTDGDEGWKARHNAIPVLKGILENVRGELDAGYTGELRSHMAGAVLNDFVQLARNVLQDNSEGAKNVASVLAAAAFEDTVRRMGRELAGLMGRDDLSDVLTALKTNGIVRGPQVSIAQSYLSFRNHALHARWDQIERESVLSLLGFVEQLLVKHFG